MTVSIIELVSVIFLVSSKTSRLLEGKFMAVCCMFVS